MKNNNLNKILRICEILSNLLEINTRYFSESNECLISREITTLPELLVPYFKGLNLSDIKHTSLDSINDTTFSQSPGYLNTVTSAVFIDGNYSGFIVVGPFLVEEPTSPIIKNVMENLHIPIALKSMLNLYYASLPSEDEYKIAYIAECLHHLILSLSIIDKNPFTLNKIKQPYSHKAKEFSQKDFQEKIEYLDNIEKEYEIENLLLLSVERGDYMTANDLLLQSPLMTDYTDLQANNPIRSYKNFSFSLNILLRKAAEKNSVPIYEVDSLFKLFFAQIDKSTNLNKIKRINSQMIKEYSLLIHHHSLLGYTPFVKKIIGYIHLNLEQTISLEHISSYLEASPSRVSRKFKEETGSTLVTYINQLRIKEALVLMESTTNTITEIAYKTGFNDANYFSRVFKKYKGITPLTYKHLLLKENEKKTQLHESF